MIDFAALCASTGIPLETLAELAGVSLNRMRRYCSGEQVPPKRVIDLVSVARLAVKAASAEHLRAAGKVRTEAQTAARRKNIARLNAGYTPEKRAAAAQKRLETLRRKKAAEKAG